MHSQQTLNSIISRHNNCRYFSVLEKGLHHVIDGLKTVSAIKFSVPCQSSVSGMSLGG